MKVCQELARYSTPTLTIGRYAHTRLHDLTQALDNLPALENREDAPETVALRATGTYGDQKYPQQIPQQSGCFSQLGAAKGCETGDISSEPADDRQVFMFAEVSEDKRSRATACETAPRRTRTFDPLIKSQLLCQLS